MSLRHSLAAGALVIAAGMGSAVAVAKPLGFIAMRVYLPAGGTTANIVPPTLVFESTDGTSKTILPCAGKTEATAELLRALAETQTGCAWAMSYGVEGMRTLNIAAPDSSAHYWVTPFLPVDSLKRIRIKGQFPEARYLSLLTYDSKLQAWLPLSESLQLTDHEIVPDAGHLNPWQQPGLAGGRFTVDVVRDRRDAGANYLPMPPPNEGGLPDILTEMPAPMANCVDGNPCLPYSTFVRPPEVLEAGMAPNYDSGYIMSRNKFGYGVVQVVRGKLPRVTRGSGPEPWLYSGNQLRYLSLCTYPMMKPYPLGACLNDQELKLDSDGYYTVVIGAPIDRPLGVVARGHSWLPHYPNPFVDHMVLLRNMVDRNFSQSAQNVPKDGKAASASSVMQEYYPASRLCTVASYQLLGKNCRAL